MGFEKEFIISPLVFTMKKYKSQFLYQHCYQNYFFCYQNKYFKLDARSVDRFSSNKNTTIKYNVTFSIHTLCYKDIKIPAITPIHWLKSELLNE